MIRAELTLRNIYRLVQKKGPVLLSTSQAEPGITFSQLGDLSFAGPCKLSASVVCHASHEPRSINDVILLFLCCETVGRSVLPPVLPLMCRDAICRLICRMILKREEMSLSLMRTTQSHKPWANNFQCSAGHDCAPAFSRRIQFRQGSQSK